MYYTDGVVKEFLACILLGLELFLHRTQCRIETFIHYFYEAAFYLIISNIRLNLLNLE